MEKNLDLHDFEPRQREYVVESFIPRYMETREIKSKVPLGIGGLVVHGLISSTWGVFLGQVAIESFGEKILNNFLSRPEVYAELEQIMNIPVDIPDFIGPVAGLTLYFLHPYYKRMKHGRKNARKRRIKKELIEEFDSVITMNLPQRNLLKE